MSGYGVNPYSFYSPIGYNPMFGQQVTGTNFGFMPPPMSYTPFGMPNYMYNRGSFMDQSPMMQQAYNPFGSFNQPMMPPPQSPSQLGIGEPPPEFTPMESPTFTPMESKVYQPPIEPIRQVENKPPAFKPYLDWTPFSVIGKKDYVPGASNRRFRDRLIGYESDGTPRYERQTVYSVPGWSPYSGGSNPKVKYGTMPID